MTLYCLQNYSTSLNASEGKMPGETLTHCFPLENKIKAIRLEQ